MTDQKTIQRILAGEQSATLQVLSWVDQVLSFHGWGDRIDREEVRQEVCLALLRNLREGQFQGEGGGLQPYVQSITRRQCLRALRRSYRRDHVDIDGIEIAANNPAPDEEMKRKRRVELMGRIMVQLSPVCRRLLILKYIRDWPHERIAEDLGLTVAAARVRLHRCMKHAMDLARDLGSR